MAHLKSRGGAATVSAVHNTVTTELVEAEEAKQRVDLLPYRVVGASREGATTKAQNLIEFNRKSYWSTARDGDDWIVLDVGARSLVSAIELFNKSATEVRVSIAAKNRKRNYITVKSSVVLPHDRRYTINVGHVPCRYVKVEFLRGNPVAVHAIRIFGLPLHLVEPRLGASLQALLCQRTQELLFGPSLELSLEPTDLDYAHRVPPRSKLMAFDETMAVLETVTATARPTRLNLESSRVPPRRPRLSPR